MNSEMQRRGEIDQDLEMFRDAGDDARDVDDADDGSPGRRDRARNQSLAAIELAYGGKKAVQRKAGGGAARDDAELSMLHGFAPGAGGSPLAGGIRERAESSTGADLSGVRVHTDGGAAAAAGAIGARAFTTGQDIYFGGGQYKPGTPDGDHLIAHEVAHTVQQRGGEASVQAKPEVSEAGDAAEVEADRAADAIVAGTPTGALREAPAAMARKEDPEEAQRRAARDHNRSCPQFLKARAFFGLPIRVASDDALVHAVERFQARHFDLDAVNGKLDAPTLQAMRDEGFESKEWLEALNQHDVLDLQVMRDRMQATDTSTVSSARNAIVEVARSQVGTVNALDRGDGKKYGAERIVAYYEDTGINLTDGQRETLKHANARLSGGPSEWCGIFATWCVRTATGIGSWQASGGHPNGFRYVTKAEDPKLANARPGDILNIAAKNHMFIYVSRSGDTFLTVDGNGDFQSVDYSSKHTAPTIVGYYSTVNDVDPTAPSGG